MKKLKLLSFLTAMLCLPGIAKAEGNLLPSLFSGEGEKATLNTTDWSFSDWICLYDTYSGDNLVERKKSPNGEWIQLNTPVTLSAGKAYKFTAIGYTTSYYTNTATVSFYNASSSGAELSDAIHSFNNINLKLDSNGQFVGESEVFGVAADTDVLINVVFSCDDYDGAYFDVASLEIEEVSDNVEVVLGEGGGGESTGGEGNIDSHRDITIVENGEFANGWTVIDANEDNAYWIPSGSSAEMSYYKVDNTFADSQHDDWIITPAQSVEAGKTYIVNLSFRGSNGMSPYQGEGEEIYVYVSQGNTASSDMEQIKAIRLNPGLSQDIQTEPFKVTESGKIYIGIHDVSGGYYGSDQLMSVKLNSISLDESNENASIEIAGVQVVEEPGGETSEFSFNGLNDANGVTGWTQIGDNLSSTPWRSAADAYEAGNSTISETNGAWVVTYENKSKSLVSPKLSLNAGETYTVKFKVLGDVQDFGNGQYKPNELVKAGITSDNEGLTGISYIWESGDDFNSAEDFMQITATFNCTESKDYYLVFEAAKGETGVFLKDVEVSNGTGGSSQEDASFMGNAICTTYDSYKYSSIKIDGKTFYKLAESKVEFVFTCNTDGTITVNDAAEEEPAITAPNAIALPSYGISGKQVKWTIPTRDMLAAGTYTITVPNDYFLVDGNPIAGASASIETIVSATFDFDIVMSDDLSTVSLVNNAYSDYINTGVFDLTVKIGNADPVALNSDESMEFELPAPAQGKYQFSLAENSVVANEKIYGYDRFYSNNAKSKSVTISSIDCNVNVDNDLKNFEVTLLAPKSIAKTKSFKITLEEDSNDEGHYINDEITAEIVGNKLIGELPSNFPAGNYKLTIAPNSLAVATYQGNVALNDEASCSFEKATVDGQGVKYNLVAGQNPTCTVAKATDKSIKNVVINDVFTYNDVDYKVVGIEAQAFEFCGALETVTLPVNGYIATIGHDAFSSCSKLNHINIPASVTTIEANAFYGDYYLTAFADFADGNVNVASNAFANGATVYVHPELASSYSFATGANMVFGHETEKTLHDGYPYYCFNKNPTVEMIYKRNFTLAENAEEGNWQALFVPHAVNVINLDGTVAELKRVYVENGRRYVEWGEVKDGTTLDANKPYIYKPGKSGEHVFTGVGAVHHDDATNSTVSKTEEEFGSFGITLTGVYAPMDVKIGDGNYYLYADGNFKMAGKNSILKPFRVFLTIQNNEHQMATTLYNVLDNGTDTPTAIGVLPFDVLESGVYYDLQGNKVVNPEQGIYILNGKKVVIK